MMKKELHPDETAFLLVELHILGICCGSLKRLVQSHYFGRQFSRHAVEPKGLRMITKRIRVQFASFKPVQLGLDYVDNYLSTSRA